MHEVESLLIISDLRQFPRSYFWLTFAEWGRKYGPLTHLNLAGMHAIVINSQEVAIDLLDKRASIYSDRPYLTMMVELCGVFSSHRLPILMACVRFTVT